jgi:hypothetical protein
MMRYSLFKVSLKFIIVIVNLVSFLTTKVIGASLTNVSKYWWRVGGYFKMPQITSSQLKDTTIQIS